MEKQYRLNRDRNIGQVIFILEGRKTEFDLLERIFVDLLGYEMAELKRGAPGFVFCGQNPYSRVVALNFKGNHLFNINPEEQDLLFLRIHQELGIKPENVPIFYLYDRDVKSYEPGEVRRYAARYGDPYGNPDGSQGQLLLSYPALESYMVTCFRENTVFTAFELGRDLKQYAAQHSCTIQMLRGEAQLVQAAREMDRGLQALGIGSYDLDRLADTLLACYDAQQAAYIRVRGFPLLSLVSMAFLELGILEEAGEA